MYRCAPIAADADEARYVYTLAGWERGPQDADIEKGRGTAQAAQAAQATISARPDPEILSACFRAGVILLLHFKGDQWEIEPAKQAETKGQSHRYISAFQIIT